MYISEDKKDDQSFVKIALMKIALMKMLDEVDIDEGSVCLLESDNCNICDKYKSVQHFYHIDQFQKLTPYL